MNLASKNTQIQKILLEHNKLGYFWCYTFFSSASEKYVLASKSLSLSLYQYRVQVLGQKNKISIFSYLPLKNVRNWLWFASNCYISP